jgi:hypothetical protein
MDFGYPSFKSSSDGPMLHGPTLIEPGVKTYLGGTLKECSKFKDKHVNSLFNISMLLLFLCIIGFFLIYKYKGKLTPSDLQIKEQHKHEYLLSKLQQLNFHRKTQQKTENKTMITGLPEW